MRHLTASQKIARLERRIAKLEREARSSYQIEVSYSLKGVTRDKRQAADFADQVEARIIRDLGLGSPSILRESQRGLDFNSTYQVSNYPNVTSALSSHTVSLPFGKVVVRIAVR